MKITRRKVLLAIWAASIISTGCLLAHLSGSIEFGIAVSLGLLSISLGVPLMRALTEFSK